MTYLNKTCVILVLLVFLTSFSSCSPSDSAPEKTPAKSRIESLKDPSAKVYEKYVVIKLPISGEVTVWNPVQIIRGPGNKMYVTNNTGEIYGLEDSDGDGIEDSANLFCDVREDGLRSPASIEFRDEALYVGVSDQIRVYLDKNKDGKADSSYTFYQDIPYSEHPYEWTSGLTFDDNGELYFVLTTDSWNASPAADPRKLRGSLLKHNGNEAAQFSTGVRSVSSMAFDAFGSLFFIDNEGGGNPTEELNIARRDAFFGHNPDKFLGHPDASGPVLNLSYDVAPSGIVFGEADDKGQNLYISYYGPGERWERGSIGKVRITRGENGDYEFEEIPFVTGLPKLSDIAIGAEGSIYVTQVGRTDYWYQSLDKPDGAIYRIIPAAWIEPDIFEAERNTGEVASESSLSLGEKLFTDKVCSACHAIDGKTELLGPNLKDIARVYSREELLEEIIYPNKRIKPSMASTRLILENGDVLIGRVVNASDDQISIMVTGNKIVKVDRDQLAKEEIVMQSLMYEGLLTGASEEEINALLDYLLSLSSAND